MGENQYDLMILGTGPAGITAALYAQRLGLKSVVLGDIPGGSVYMIDNIMNYPGFIGGVPGAQFGTIAFQQAQTEGAHFPLARLDRLTHENGIFSGNDANGQPYAAKCAIVATGRVPKRLSVPNANLKGVHFCSICDGPLYRGKNATLAVIGSDNVAAQHAMTLARVADKVYLICRSESFLMDAIHKRAIENQANIEVVAGMEVIGYNGSDFVETLFVKSEGAVEKEVPVDGVFLAIGWKPNTDLLDIPVEKTTAGYLKTNDKLMTSFPGLFAAGDVRDTDMWQVLTACADGARAAKSASEHIRSESPAR
jgi:thioredoxin reductase (NADPH)